MGLLTIISKAVYRLPVRIKQKESEEQMVTECIYCEEHKETRIWQETGEEVCYDCRLGLLDQEFNSRDSRNRAIHQLKESEEQNGR